MKEHKVTIPCDCGCCLVNIEKIDEDQVSIIYYMNTFYGKQDSKIFSTIIRRLKMIWSIIIGKEYLLEDCSISLNDFKKYFKEIEENIIK